MRRFINLYLILLGVFQPAWAQKPVFRVKYAEPLAVFMFVKNLGANTGENPFKTVFQQSKYNQPRYTELIKRYDGLTLDYSYKFQEFPVGSKVPGMTSALLKKNLIDSKDLKEFRLRSVGVIPNATLHELSEILTEFTQVYRELVYEPNKQAFDTRLSGLAAYVAANDPSTYFETGLKFYRSVWDAEIPFEIACYPLPNANGFTAEAFFNNAVSAIQTELLDYPVLLSVMMHEIFHIEYDEQPLQVKQDIHTWFTESKSKCSNYAYWLFNEAMATALGNGYVYESLTGKADPGEWYNWKYINLMAKSIYPLLKEYLRQGKSIDRTFVEDYIRLYEESYSHWINEPEHVMSYRYVLISDEADFYALAGAYSNSSFWEAETEVTAASLNKMKEMPLTKVVVVSKEHAAQLELVKRTFPELATWKYDSKKEFVHTVFLKDKTQLYVINRIFSSTGQLLDRLIPATR